MVILVGGTYNEKGHKDAVKLLLPYTSTSQQTRTVVAVLKARILIPHRRQCLEMQQGSSLPRYPRNRLVKMSMQILLLDPRNELYYLLAGGLAAHFHLDQFHRDIAGALAHLHDASFSKHAGVLFTNAAVMLRGWGTRVDKIITVQFLRSVFYLSAKEFQHGDAMLEISRCFVQSRDFQRALLWLDRYEALVARGGEPAVPGRRCYLTDLRPMALKGVQSLANGTALLLGWETGSRSVLLDTRGMRGVPADAGTESNGDDEDEAKMKP